MIQARRAAFLQHNSLLEFLRYWSDSKKWMKSAAILSYMLNMKYVLQCCYTMSPYLYLCHIERHKNFMKFKYCIGHFVILLKILISPKIWVLICKCVNQILCIYL